MLTEAGPTGLQLVFQSRFHYVETSVCVLLALLVSCTLVCVISIGIVVKVCVHDQSGALLLVGLDEGDLIDCLSESTSDQGRLHLLGVEGPRRLQL